MLILQIKTLPCFNATKGAPGGLAASVVLVNSKIPSMCACLLDFCKLNNVEYLINLIKTKLIRSTWIVVLIRNRVKDARYQSLGSINKFSYDL